jgi:hypothetical protein
MSGIFCCPNSPLPDRDFMQVGLKEAGSHSHSTSETPAVSSPLDSSNAGPADVELAMVDSKPLGAVRAKSSTRGMTAGVRAGSFHRGGSMHRDGSLNRLPDSSDEGLQAGAHIGLEAEELTRDSQAMHDADVTADEVSSPDDVRQY